MQNALSVAAASNRPQDFFLFATGDKQQGRFIEYFISIRIRRL
jgi:hypothetical protein